MSAFILWPPCTCGFGIREKIWCGLQFFGVFLCGFAVFGPPLRPPPSLLCLLVFSLDILRLPDCKFVFWLLSMCKVLQKCQVNVNVTRKRELSQKRNLCWWGAWKFSAKKYLHRENAQTIYFISMKAFKRYAWFLKHCPQKEKKRETIITQVLSFL